MTFSHLQATLTLFFLCNSVYVNIHTTQSLKANGGKPLGLIRDQLWKEEKAPEQTMIERETKVVTEAALADADGSPNSAFTMPLGAAATAFTLVGAFFAT